MSSLLRKVKSAILTGAPPSTTAGQSSQYGSSVSRVETQNVSGTPPPLPPLPPKGSTTNLLDQFSTLRHRRKSRIDLSTAVESPQSIEARQTREEQRNKEHSLSQLPRRLVRKASTFNLHSRGHLGSTFADKGYHKRNRRSEHLFLDADTDTEEKDHNSATFPAFDEQVRSSTGSVVYSEAVETIARHDSVHSCGSAYSHTTAIPGQLSAVATSTSRPSYDPKPLPNPITKLFVTAERSVSEAQTLLAAHVEHRKPTEPSEGTWAKMAGPGAEPPLAYERLKEITNDVCPSNLITFPLLWQIHSLLSVIRDTNTLSARPVPLLSKM